MVERLRIRGVEIAGRWTPATNAGDLALVWGHGLTSSMEREDDGLLIDWDRITAEISTFRYDARGHGSSGTTPGPDEYGWGELAHDQLELTAEVGIERYVAAGASMGAATALHAAVLAPDRISGLVLVIPPTGWETRAEQVGNYAKMAAVLERHGVDPLIRAAATDLAVPAPFVGRGEWEQRYVESLRAADPSRLATIFRGAGTADFPTRQQVAGIRVPTRILAWAGDPGHPVSSAEELAALIPDAELSVATSWDDQRAWTSDIVTFLRRLHPVN